MKPYCITTGYRLSPFGDPVGETFILQKTLAFYQKQALETSSYFKSQNSTAALVPPSESVSGPALLYSEDLFFTRYLLDAFIEAAGGKTGQLAVEKCQFMTSNHPLQDLQEVIIDKKLHYLFPMYCIADNDPVSVPDPDDSEANNNFSPISVSLDEKLLSFPVSAHYFGTDKMEFGLTARALMRIRHWVHISWVNQAAAAAAWRAQSILKTGLVLILAILRAFSFNKWKILAKINRKGKGCDIHPSAIVEGSTLGKGCSIGPGARVRFSHLGDNVFIQPGAQVEFSILGDRVMVSQNCAVNYCVCYPDSVASQLVMQVSVLGRRAITTTGSFLMDMRVDRDILVEKEGKLVSTKTRFIGSCIGHDAFLGTGFWINSGREIPNGYVVIRDVSKILNKIPKNLSKRYPLVIRDGTLVPVGKKEK